MPHHKAILIQNLTDYADILLPHIRRVIACHGGLPISDHEVLHWVVKEELSRVYCIFSSGHLRRQAPYEQVYENIQRSLRDVGMNLNTLTSFYLKAPKIYADSDEVVIYFRGPDMYITYFSNLVTNPYPGIR